MEIVLDNIGTSYHFNASIEHKLNRIKQEVDFKQNNRVKFDCITKREREVIKKLVSGWSNPEIADQLFISKYTVEQHRKNIYRKLSIRSVPHLFQYALAFDLI